jgi:hypothetical protein
VGVRRNIRDSENDIIAAVVQADRPILYGRAISDHGPATKIGNVEAAAVSAAVSRSDVAEQIIVGRSIQRAPIAMRPPGGFHRPRHNDDFAVRADQKI